MTTPNCVGKLGSGCKVGNEGILLVFYNWSEDIFVNTSVCIVFEHSQLMNFYYFQYCCGYCENGGVTMFVINIGMENCWWSFVAVLDICPATWHQDDGLPRDEGCVKMWGEGTMLPLLPSSFWA